MGATVFCLVVSLLAAVSAAPQSRIVGGVPTTINEFPYVVSLTYYYPNIGITIQRCVGALLSSYHVLTTGYCYTGAVEENIRIRAGSTLSLTGGVVVSVAEVFKHPDYSETPRTADLAVTLLSEPIFLSNVIGIVQIPYQGYPIAVGAAGQVVSWGFEYVGGPQLEFLKAITVNKIDNQVCQDIYEGNENAVIDDNVLCATAPGVGTCLGDSGASLVIDNVIVGIASFFVECGSDEYPDVYTRVDRYADWIMSVATAPGKDSARMVTL